MSQMPSKILLHKDEKYNTGDFYIAHCPVAIEMKAADGDVDINDYVEYCPKEQLIEKAAEWLKEQEEMIGISFQQDFYERFRQAIKKWL